LLLDEQGTLGLWVMGIVASGAANIIFGVGRPREIGVLIAVAVTSKAALGSFLGAQIFEADNFADVTTAIHVGLARTMTSFAALMFGRGFLILNGREVSSALEVLGQVLVASFTNLGADVFRSRRPSRVRRLRRGTRLGCLGCTLTVTGYG